MLTAQQANDLVFVSAIAWLVMFGVMLLVMLRAKTTATQSRAGLMFGIATLVMVTLLVELIHKVKP